MKILQIYELSPLESVGGIEVAILELSKELVKLGHQVTILSGAGYGNGDVSQEGIETINFDFMGTMKRTYTPGRLTLIRQLLFLSSLMAKRPELKFEIYHGHIYTSGLIATYLAKRNKGIAVNTIHGSYYPAWRRLTNPLTASFYRIAEKQLAMTLSKHSNLQIHVSTYFADQVTLWGGVTKVIPNGVDASVFNGKSEAFIDCTVPVILTARRLVKKNGVEFLIRAMAHLKDECKLVIIGDGPERARLEALANRQGNVEFLGEVPHKDMPQYIAGADIAVVPSIIEASSLFMLEAMAMSKPVIASKVGGLPEVLTEAGVLVPPSNPSALGSAIQTLLNNPKKMRRLGKCARNRVIENYTWEKIARRVEGEYLSLRGDENA
jgi:glycosyltransferase involved in cell wall biosynthesis